VKLQTGGLKRSICQKGKCEVKFAKNTCEANFAAKELLCRKAASLARQGKLSFGTAYGCAEDRTRFVRYWVMVKSMDMTA